MLDQHDVDPELVAFRKANQQAKRERYRTRREADPTGSQKTEGETPEEPGYGHGV